MNLRLAIGKAVCRPALGRLLSFVFGGLVPHSGMRIDVRHPSVLPANAVSIFLGLYERSEVRIVSRFLPPDQDVIELGSSLGVLSAHIARRLEPGRKLVCVEANPALIGLVRSNALRAAPGRDTQVVNAAIDYEGAETLFRVDPGHLGSAITREVEGALRVPSITLSELAARHRVGRFTLVSDIEGAEAELFSREESLLRERCDTIIAELHPAPRDGAARSVEEVASGLGNIGYEVTFRRNNVFVFRRKAVAGEKGAP